MIPKEFKDVPLYLAEPKSVQSLRDWLTVYLKVVFSEVVCRCVTK